MFGSFVLVMNVFFSTFYLQSWPCLENTGLFDPLLLGNSQMEAWKKTMQQRGLHCRKGWLCLFNVYPTYLIGGCAFIWLQSLLKEKQ